MTPLGRPPHGPDKWKVWPCRVAPDVLADLLALTEKEREFRDPRMTLGRFVDRELREVLRLRWRDWR